METEQRNEKFRILMAFGIVGPVVALSLTLVDVILSPWFNWSTSALSDLGVHQDSFLFNIGLIFEAAANLLFVIGLKKLKLTGTGTALALGVAGVSLGFVGIFNENHHPFHLIFALIYFIVFPLSIIAFSAGKRNSRGYARAVGYFTAVIGLIFIIVGIIQDFGVVSTPLGLGFYELVEAIMLSVWMIYTGGFYLAVNRSELNESGAAHQKY